MAGTMPFFPGVIDYDEKMYADYQAGRALSQDAATTWRAILQPFVQRPGSARIVDVGAGTGRFSALFARSFQAHVVGIEPSLRMLAATSVGAQPTNLAYVAGSAERIPLRNQSCDLAWLSQVWHHIRDRHGCASELRRILSPVGDILVRGAFGDQLEGFPTLFHYWPAARDVCQQLPTIHQTVAIFEAHGFVLTEHRCVPQRTCASHREFAGRTRVRADTALALISDSDFWKGQDALEMAAAQELVSDPVIEVIELLVFRRSIARSTV